MKPYVPFEKLSKEKETGMEREAARHVGKRQSRHAKAREPESIRSK